MCKTLKTSMNTFSTKKKIKKNKDHLRNDYVSSFYYFKSNTD